MDQPYHEDNRRSAMNSDQSSKQSPQDLVRLYLQDPARLRATMQEEGPHPHGQGAGHQNSFEQQRLHSQNSTGISNGNSGQVLGFSYSSSPHLALQLSSLPRGQAPGGSSYNDFGELDQQIEEQKNAAQHHVGTTSDFQQVIHPNQHESYALYKNQLQMANRMGGNPMAQQPTSSFSPSSSSALVRHVGATWDQHQGQANPTATTSSHAAQHLQQFLASALPLSNDGGIANPGMQWHGADGGVPHDGGYLLRGLRDQHLQAATQTWRSRQQPLLPPHQNANQGGLGATVEEGSALVPCRARGMPQGHNAETAFFVTKKDIKHGDGLKCSHSQCHKKGIRFVYCKVCQVPVAKINFTTRHKHADAIHDTSSKTGAHEQQQNKRAVLESPVNSVDEYTKRKGEEDEIVGIDDIDDFGYRKKKKKARMENTFGALNEQQKGWLSLLQNRPRITDDEKMKQWLSAVVLKSESITDNSTKQEVLESDGSDTGATSLSKLVREGLVKAKEARRLV